jgi:hypothetical protein
MDAASPPTPSPHRLQEVLDRQDIWDALVTLSRGADRSDRELFLSAFHPDAVIDLGGFAGGPAELYDWSSKLGDNTHSEHHYILNHHVEIDGATAHAETYFLYVAASRDGSKWQCGGRYIDRFERRDGAWRIGFRYNIIEWTGLLGNVDLPFEIPERPNGVPSRDRTDPSYRRPLKNLREPTPA